MLHTELWPRCFKLVNSSLKALQTSGWLDIGMRACSSCCMCLKGKTSRLLCILSQDLYLGLSGLQVEMPGVYLLHSFSIQAAPVRFLNYAN